MGETRSRSGGLDKSGHSPQASSRSHPFARFKKQVLGLRYASLTTKGWGTGEGAGRQVSEDPT